MPAGNYEYFASQAESLFVAPEIAAMDEYGIPFDLARRLTRFLHGGGSLDRTLERLRALDADALNLGAFEKRLLKDAQKHA